ncbi:MAG: CARDB domain-containing protein, partial [Archaeoglobaceae archaeon]
VTATASSGYIFDHWELDGNNVGTSPSYTVTMNAPHNLVAVFRQTQREVDLTFFIIGFNKPSPHCDGDTVYFGAVLINQGTTGASNFRVDVYLDGRLYDSGVISYVGGGESITLWSEYPWIAKSGIHNLTWIVDLDNRVIENNEGNNQAIRIFEVVDCSPTPPPTTPPTPPPTTPPPTTSAKIFIEPNKTTVAPGGIFAVDISVQDGTAQSVLLNFTFDTSKISYVTGSTQGVFNTIDTISSSANYVRYLGVSSSPVNIASKTKVATAVFQVNSGASGTLSFNVVTASVNGANAMPIVQSIKIGTEPWQSYDSNGNDRIEDQELIAAIMDWLNNRISDLELINVIMKWLQG